MGGARELRALRVHQITSRMLEAGRIQAEPPWYRVVAAIPPTTSLVRSLPVQFKDRKPRKLNRKQSNLFKPQKIVYPEDKLRGRFFRDHPWELARPRILVENDGRDFTRYDWSKLQQPERQTDGENVVQRQLWLMENENKSETEAYDVARKEFYDIRMQEDIERRVASEEARAVGAQFGKSYLEVGIQLEEEALNDWKAKAMALLTLKRGRQAAFTGGSGDEESTEVADELIEQPET